MALVDQIIGVESGGNPNARNPRSSAAGPGQFIDSTWLGILAKHRPDLVQGRSKDDILALKTDPQLARDMTTALAADNAGILRSAGLPETPGNTYLAHFAGPQGAIGILNADPTASAGAVLGQKVVDANPFLAGMTAADVRSWADRKMGGGGAMAGSEPGKPSAAPLSFAGPAGDTAALPAAPDEAEAAKPSSLAGLAWLNSEEDQPPPMLLPPRNRIQLSSPAQSRAFSFRGSR